MPQGFANAELFKLNETSGLDHSWPGVVSGQMDVSVVAGSLEGIGSVGVMDEAIH